MAIEVFNRYEEKYIISKEVFYSLRDDLKEYLELDPYNQNNAYYSIYNYYLDTINDDLIQQSLQKPTYKEKVRIRSYYDFKAGEMVFLEIKKKCGGIVNKRRTQMKLEEAVFFVKTGKIPKIQDYMNGQVLKELEYLFSKEALMIKTWIKYDRIAYFSKERKDLRITFDTNIRSKRPCCEEQVLLSDDWIILEIKAGQNMPLWLTKILTDYHLQPASFSKYGKEYQFYHLQNQLEKLYPEMEKSYLEEEYVYA